MTTDQTEPSCGRGCHSIEQGCPVHDPDTPDAIEREAKAAAWDEGYEAGWWACHDEDDEPRNPYQEADQ